jgi:hypothetical protein
VGFGYLLTRGIHDFSDEGLSVCVIVLEDVGGDFNQERVQDTLIPTGKDFRAFSLCHPQSPFHKVIGLQNVSTLIKNVHQVRKSRQTMESGEREEVVRFTSQINCMSPYSMPLWTILT